MAVVIKGNLAEHRVAEVVQHDGEVQRIDDAVAVEIAIERRKVASEAEVGQHEVKVRLGHRAVAGSVAEDVRSWVEVVGRGGGEEPRAVAA